MRRNHGNGKVENLSEQLTELSKSPNIAWNRIPNQDELKRRRLGCRAGKTKEKKEDVDRNK